MPTYDYVCTLCGHELEIFQSMTEGAKRKCPACGEQGLKRRIGAGAGLIFKGSGFYQTDYRKKGGAGESKAEKDPEEKKPARDSKGSKAKGEKTGGDSKGS